jgi:glycosyltransferase involved in cell wall biosynthesis
VFRPPDIARGSRHTQTEIVVGTIARESVVKGYPDFLRALALLPADLSIHLHVARPDPVPLPERFTVETERPTTETDMARFYGKCDVFVFSSRAEGFGLPALEAMACGCAVVTTDCGGVNAFARPGENCLMVPPGDSRAIADAIAAAVRDPELRARLGSGGLRTAEAFGRDAVLDRFCDFLERLVRLA